MSRKQGVWTAVLALAALAVVSAVRAQQAAVPGTSSENVRIRKFTKAGRSAMVRSPEYQTNVGRSALGSRKPREWAYIEVQYDTAPDWVDEVEISFHVLTEERTPEGKKVYNLYRCSSRFADIAKGEHLAAAVLPPSAVERHGEPVGLAVEIAVGGQVVVADQSVSINMPANWWRNPTVVDAPAVTKRDGFLVDRSKTPFAFANIDDYDLPR